MYAQNQQYHTAQRLRFRDIGCRVMFGVKHLIRLAFGNPPSPTGEGLRCRIFCVKFVHGLSRAPTPTKIVVYFLIWVRKCTLSFEKGTQTLSEGNTQLFFYADACWCRRRKSFAELFLKATVFPFQKGM